MRDPVGRDAQRRQAQLFMDEASVRRIVRLRREPGPSARLLT